MVEIKEFEQTSSTKLEIQTLLWAFEKINNLIGNNYTSLTVYHPCRKTPS